MFIKHSFKIFRCNPNDTNFDLYKFLGELSLHISTLRDENVANKVINKITDDFEKIVSKCDKMKIIKSIFQKHFTKLQKLKNT